MKVVITGTSNGIGQATAIEFLKYGHEVIGIDLEEPDFWLAWRPNYRHICGDVRYLETLEDIENVDILINNAGIQGPLDVIQTNLQGVINCTKKYGLQPNIKSIVNIASVSAHNGAEFSEYVASKGGVVSYTKWTAKEIAKYGATCNSLSFGGVLTDLNKPVIENDELWDRIMDMTPLKKWATPEECAEWIHFISAVNKSCTAQDIIIDNGEFYNHTFIW